MVTGFAVLEMSPEPNDSFANTLVKFLSLGPAAETLLEAVNIPISVQRELYNELSTPPPPSALSIATVLFWSISVTCTLCIFVYAFYVKFWLHEFRRDLRNGSLYDYARRRQARWDAMLKFKVEEWVLGLPLLMHLSVIFFFLGFVMKLWSYHRLSAYVVMALAVWLLMVYMGMTAMAAWREMCPYHNTAMMVVPKIFSSLFGSLGAAGRWMLRKMPISMLRRAPESASKLMSNMDLEKGSVESVSTFPLYHAHPRSDREDEFVEKYSNELDWNMVAWLLTTCRRSSSVDLALKSIRTLPYVPRKAYEMLSTGIPRLLYSKILTDDEEILEEDESWVAEETYEFTLSFIYILKCLALDGEATDASLASSPTLFFSSAYGLLDETNMEVWTIYKTADPPLEQEPLPIKNFVALISMETLFYHLHPQTNEQDGDPMVEMHALLERHVTKKAPLDGRSLALLLDTLVYVLARGKHDANVNPKLLPLLARVARMITTADSLVFRPLASCFKLLLDGEAGTTVLREHMDAPRESRFVSGPGSGHKALFDVLMVISVPDGDADDDDDLKSNIAQAVFSLAPAAVTVGAALSMPIIRDNCTMLVNAFDPEKDTEEWTVDFFTSVYEEDQSDLSTLHHLLLRILRSLSKSTTNLRQEFASRILQCFKSRLHKADVVDVEKAKICRQLFEAMREDKTLFLIFTVTKDRWFDDLRDVFLSVQGSIVPDVNRLLLVWDAVGRLGDGENILLGKDTWDTLRALSG